MSKNYAIIIHFILRLTAFYRSGAHRSDVYKWDAFVTSRRFYNRAWQPQRHHRLPETSGTLWIHRGALTNQRCSLATGCGINFLILASQYKTSVFILLLFKHCSYSVCLLTIVFRIVYLQTAMYKANETNLSNKHHPSENNWRNCQMPRQEF